MKLDPRAATWSKERFLYEEQLDALAALERRMRKEKRVPDRRTVLFVWLRPILTALVGVALGINVGMFAVLVAFFILAKTLHITVPF